ncbi:MAG: hypothetical protein CVV22_00780 [Ignavibacteriae bacterium HGW-Ignavibacteriae-1]|jgi:hypothetical protein|nr:MAG: hypothetical protein CVV22_00780 [Ignavibacteriae bacterium HGW-Ignavibacteriae-1]
MKYLLLFLFLLSYSVAFSQPQIEIEGDDIYDWGQIDNKGKPLTATVKIYNKGNETLNISQVKPDCGCTIAPLDKNIVEPNDFATLSITLHVYGDGPLYKSIVFESNDPKTPHKNLSLTADVQRPIGVSPTYFNFGLLEINKEVQSSIRIKNNTNESIKIKDIIMEQVELVLNVDETTVLEAKSDLIIVAKYTPKTPTNITGKVTVKTDLKEMDAFVISVYGKFQE